MVLHIVIISSVWSLTKNSNLFIPILIRILINESNSMRFNIDSYQRFDSISIPDRWIQSSEEGGSHQILQENPENRLNVEGVFLSEISGYFPVVFDRFQQKETRKCWNWLEKSGNFLDGILPPHSVDFRYSRAGIGPSFFLPGMLTKTFF